MPRKIQDYVFESQTYSLKNAPVYIKILSVFYKILGRKLFAKLLVTTYDCTLCNHCLNECPNKAIEIHLKNLRKNNKCKGCLLCAATCPHQAYVMPLSAIISTVLLLFLPYDEFIRGLLPFQFSSVPMLINILISFILWSVGYVITIYLFRKITFVLSTLPFVKKLMNNAYIKKIYRAIHPVCIFPVIVTENYAK